MRPCIVYRLQIRWLSAGVNFVIERYNFVFNSFRNFEPVNRFQKRSAVLEFRSLENSSSKSILGVLKTIYLIFRKTTVERFGFISPTIDIYCW